MDLSTEMDAGLILRSVGTILKVPYSKAFFVKLAKCDESFIAEWFETSFNKLAENNDPNVTHTINEVDSPNVTEININQNEVSSNAPINSKNSLSNIACEEPCSTNNENRKRLRSRSVTPTREQIFEKNLSDFKATMAEVVKNVSFDERKRLLDREKEIDEEIGDKNISGMREKSLLNEKSKIRRKLRSIKRENEEVLPILDVIDFGTKTTAKPCDSSGELKPLISKSIQVAREREGPSPPKIRSPTKLRSSTTPSPSLRQPSLSDTEVNVESFSDTAVHSSKIEQPDIFVFKFQITPNDVSIPSVSDISSNHRKGFNFEPKDLIHVEKDRYMLKQGSKQTFEQAKIDGILPKDAPGSGTQKQNAGKEIVLTKQNELCGYKLGPKAWKCSTCSRTFTSSHNLRIHAAFTHGVGKAFKCGVCGGKYLGEENVRQHKELFCPGRDKNFVPRRQRSQSVYQTTF